MPYRMITTVTQLTLQFLGGKTLPGCCQQVHRYKPVTKWQFRFAHNGVRFQALTVAAMLTFVTLLRGLIPIDYVYDLLTKSLKTNGINLWIIIDRLDVAFTESEELETNALRALFTVYLDLVKYTEIKIKIFLRDDIWNRITSEGFREASHITKFQSLGWTRESLLN